MVELRRGLRFANEPHANVAIERDVRWQNFDRHRAVQTEIGRAIHHGHPAMTDGLEQHVIGDAAWFHRGFRTDLLKGSSRGSS